MLTDDKGRSRFSVSYDDPQAENLLWFYQALMAANPNTPPSELKTTASAIQNVRKYKKGESGG